LGYRRLRLPVLLLMALLLWRGPFAAHAALADSPASPDQRELRIERTLACPQCTDLPLDVCDQDICADMRSLIRQQIAEGKSDAAIREFFVDRYGSRVLLAPRKDAGDSLVWLMPFLGLLIGAGAIAVFLRRAARRSDGTGSALSASPAVARYRGTIEQDLQDIG
jgi:cytochrome c-type biogenesis protein CcmH